MFWICLPASQHDTIPKGEVMNLYRTLFISAQQDFNRADISWKLSCRWNML